jgi:hypothetical protein
MIPTSRKGDEKWGTPNLTPTGPTHGKTFTLKTPCFNSCRRQAVGSQRVQGVEQAGGVARSRLPTGLIDTATAARLHWAHPNEFLRRTFL